MSKHTPGPWKWAPGDPAIEGPNGGAVCHVAEHANVRTGLATGEYFRSADARLIAAAPELLKALKWAMGILDASNPCDEACTEACSNHMARALIRRIEGES